MALIASRMEASAGIREFFQSGILHFSGRDAGDARAIGNIGDDDGAGRNHYALSNTNILNDG